MHAPMPPLDLNNHGRRRSCSMARWLQRALTTVVLMLAAVPLAQAHLMVAQRGTLNIVGNGAFMVLSLPVSAFSDVDDDGDGMMSMAEFKRHQATIVAAVQKGVRLTDSSGARQLDGLMLTLSPADGARVPTARHLVAMGRFAQAAPPATTDEALRLHISLFGQSADEQTFHITATHRAAGDKRLLVLTPEQSSRLLFPPAWSVFTDYIKLGAQHILFGLDHLLFLLVVLTAGWSWRQLLIALTAFTVGHACTLTIAAWGWVTVPATVVEPTVAATIVLLALYDWRLRRRQQTGSPWWRLVLVFGCALIHGLGLASALSELGLDPQHQLLSLAGFNVGIELGQLVVAGFAAIAAFAVQRLLGAYGLRVATRLASFTAVGAGTFWFVQRVLAAG